MGSGEGEDGMTATIPARASGATPARLRKPWGALGQAAGAKVDALVRHERATLRWILGISLLIQLVLAPYVGFWTDLQQYMSWGVELWVHPLHVYAGVSTTAYPPLSIYLFGVTDATYGVLAHLLGLASLPTTYYPWTSLPAYAFMWLWLKLPMIASQTLAVWLVYKLARSFSSARLALLAATVYAFNPVTWLDGAVWGQLDAFPVAFLLLGMLLIQSKRPVWAGIVLGAMAMIKPQPVIFVPVCVVYALALLGRRGAFRFVVASGATVAVICAPYVIPPQPELLFMAKHAMTVPGTGATVDAFNLWYAIRPDLTAAHQFGPLTTMRIGLILFVLVYVLALGLVWRVRSPGAIYLALSLVAFSFFVVTTGQRERYSIQAIAVLVLAAVAIRPVWRAALLVSFTSLVNVLSDVVMYLSTHLPAPNAYIGIQKLVLFYPNYAVIVAWINVEVLAGLVVISLIHWRQQTRTADVREGPMEDIDTAVLSVLVGKTAGREPARPVSANESWRIL